MISSSNENHRPYFKVYDENRHSCRGPMRTGNLSHDCRHSSAVRMLDIPKRLSSIANILYTTNRILYRVIFTDSPEF